MYRKSLTIIALLALLTVNVSYAGQAISEDNTKIGILKSKVDRGEVLTPAEGQIAKENNLFPVSTNNPINNPSRDVNSGGPDAFGYSWVNSDNSNYGPTYTWIDITGATPIYDGLLGDDYRARVGIPFDFYFYGSWTDSVWITTNGWAGFDASYSSSYWTNNPIPYSAAPNKIAAPLWDDFKAASATSYHGTLYHKTTGFAPNRQFTLIWWELVRSYGDTNYFSFEMVLSEGTNNITFQYYDVVGNDIADNGIGGTVGIENGNGTVGLEYEYNGVPQLVYDGMAIEFIAPEPVEAAPIFFSEYAEGSSNNKYLEIYNPTNAEVDLDQYVILGNYNGNPWSEAFTFAAGATIDTGSVYVIANASASDAIQALADEVLAYADPWYTAAFNGDDVRALAQIVGTDTTILDIIGTLDGDGDGMPGEGSEDDPGGGFDVAGVTEATKDHTLVRKDDVVAGNGGDWVTSAGTDSLSSEWIVGERPTADYLPATLGWHMDENAPVPCDDNELTFNMYDSYGDSWNGNVYMFINSAGEVVATGGMTDDNCSDGGFATNPCNFAADIICLPDGAYNLVVDGGSWQSEVTWDLVDNDTGEMLASGGAPYDGEILINVAPATFLKINEFLANSELCCDNGNGDSTDFIEIYNPGEEAVDIGGLWITDDLDSPAEWEQIPTTDSTITTVAAGGFIVIWADEQQETGGPLHTVDIKLSSGGEQIGLINIVGTDTVFIDSLSFGAQAEDTSRGRDPDGSDTWVSLSPPSPGITNYTCSGNIVTFHMYDSYGDGWNGSTYTLVEYFSGDTAGTGGLLSGSEGADEYCLSSGFYNVAVGGGSWLTEVSWEMSMLSSVDGLDSVFASGGAPFAGTVTVDTTGILGCMDPLAANYDSTATLDDGSCYLIGDFCDSPLTAALDSNAASGTSAYGGQWFVYTAVSTGFLTATTCYAGQMEDTDLYVYDGCPAAGGALIAESDDAQCEEITGGNPYGSEATFVSDSGTTYWFYWADTWNYYQMPFTWLLNSSPSAPYNLTTTVGVEELGLSWSAYTLSQPVLTREMGRNVQNDSNTLSAKKASFPAMQTEMVPSVTKEEVMRKYASRPQTTRDSVSVLFTLYDSYGDGYGGSGYIADSTGAVVLTAPGGWYGTESAYPVTLADGLYTVYFDQASWVSETSWEIVNASDGNIIYGSGTASASATAPQYFALGDYDVPSTDLTANNIGFNYWTDLLTVDVINAGEVAASGFYVMLYVTNDVSGDCYNGTYESYSYVSTGLAGGDTLTLAWSGLLPYLEAVTGNAGGFGSYNFGVMVDWSCAIGESDETNNTYSQAVDIVSPLEQVVFNVYRQDSTEGFSMVGSVSGQTNYLDTGLEGNHMYGYKVDQVDYVGADTSAKSVVGYGTPLPAIVLPVPPNMNGEANGWRVDLSWGNVVPEVEGQGFESGVIPEGWATTTNSAVGWFITEDATSDWWPVPPGNGFYAASNDDAANDDGSMDYLITPATDFTTGIPPVLSFRSYFDGTYSQTAHVEVSTDGGESFTEVALVTPSADWATVNVDLSAYATETSVMVAFHSNDNGAWASGWAVDDIVLGQTVDPIYSYFDGYYNLYRYDISGANVATELLANTSDRSFSIYQTEEGTYTYAVTALYDIYGESGVSNTVDVVVTAPDPNAPPGNLTAETMGNDVHLDWVPPPGGPAWLSHSEGNIVTAIGTDGPAEFSVAHRFDRGPLYDYDGMFVTQIELIPNVSSATYQPFVMEVPVGATPVFDEYIVSVGEPVSGTDLLIGQWSAVPVPPHQVDWNYELWFGYHVVTPEGYPAGCTAGPALAGYGDLIAGFGAPWGSMVEAYGLDYNWALGAFIDYPPPPPQVMMNPGFEETWCCMNDWQNVATGWHQWPVENGSHTVDATGTGIYGSSDTLVAFDGMYSLKMWGLYSGAASTNAYYQTFTGESWNHPIFPPGTRISVDGEIMSHADDWIGQGTNTVTLFLSYWDINWGFISRHDSPVFSAADEATVWHHRHIEGLVPEGAVYVNIGVELSQADNNQHGSAYIDNVVAHLVPPDSTGGTNMVANTIQTGKVSSQFDLVGLIPTTNGLDLPIMEQEERSMLQGYEVRDGGDSIAATNMMQNFVDLMDEEWGSHVYTVVAVYDDGISQPTNAVELNLVNSPPSEFSLVAPPQGAALAIDENNIDGDAAFVWQPSSDVVDNDPISYTLWITETESGMSMSFDTTGTGIFVPFMAVVDFMMATGDTTTSFEWTVFAHDDWDSTAASNGPRSFTVDLSDYLSAINGADIPDEFALYNNYPNPFNPITNIKYDISEVADVRLEIYNIAGQRIRTLVQGQHEPGRYKVQWAAKNDYGRPVASGMYIYRIRAGDFVSVKKLILMK